MKIHHASYLICASLLAGCLMGGGSDQPNRLDEQLLGRATWRDGQPAVEARVRLFQGNYKSGFDTLLAQSSAILDSEATSDTSGKFAFLPFTGPHFLEIISQDSSQIGIIPSLSLIDSKSTAQISLADAASLQGLLVSKSLPKSLHLAGTHFQTVPDNSGHFRFSSLPPGDYRLVANFGGSAASSQVSIKTLTLEAGQVMDLDTVRAESGQISLFDFDSATQFNGLRGLTYPFTQPQTSRVGKWGPSPFTLAANGALHGRSFYTAFKKKNQATGFALGNGYYNLSKMTAFVFFAKGKGEVDLHFHSQPIPTPGEGFRKTIILDSIWTEYRVLPKDIIVPKGSIADLAGINWESGKTGVSKITFSANDIGVDLYLDDIRIEGMDYTDFGPSRPAGTDTYPL